jgi:hypothetical protein
MALGYGDVRDIYDTLKGAGVVTQGLPEWSEEMNRLSGTNLYDAGKHDNIIKQFSHTLDKVLEESGLVDVGREFGRASGELVGAPEVGAQIGAGLPRSTINFAPLFVPGVGWGAAAARLGGTALLSGAGTYTETDSPLAGLISGGTTAAFPSVARFGEGLIKNRVGSFLSGQLLAGGFSEASGAVQTLAQGETPEFHPVNTLLGLTLGQAPFAAIHLGTKVLGIGPKAIEVANKVTQERTARDEVAKVPPIATIPDTQTPDVVSFNVLRETEQRLSQIRGEQVKVQEDLTLSPEEKVNKVNALLAEESELQRQKEQVVGDTVLGDIIRPDTTRTQVLGKEVARNAAGTWRAIHVADVDKNPPELRNKVVGYSTLHEPNPELTETYNLRYSLPPEQWLTPKTLEEWQARGRKAPDPNQPTLPVQPREPTREEMFGHIQQLDEAKVEVDGATTPGELQKTVTKINEVKEQVGLPPTNDRSLRQKVATLNKSGLVDPDDLLKVATKVEAEDAKRQLNALEAGHVSALFGETGAAPRGFHLIEPRIPKDAGGDVETKSVSDIVTDVAYGAIQHREAVEATRGQDPAQVGKDREDFIDLIEHFGSTKVDPKVATKFLNERFGTVGWDEKEYADFVARPYVAKWQDLLERGLSRIVSRSPQPSVLRVPAGDDWVWGIRPIEQIKGLSKEGVMPAGRFRNTVSDRGSMSQAEFDLLKLVVPEAFKDETVDVRKLYELLPRRSPVVEVRKLGGPRISEDLGQQARQDRLAQVRHELDTLTGNADYSQWELGTPFFDRLPQRAKDLFKELVDLESGVAADEGRYGIPDDAPHYSFLGPKLESEMPGYVEGLVRLPANIDKLPQTKLGARLLDEKVGIKYRGPHFGSEDTNVLAFYRGYEETLPDGTKAFHVIEVQSDWGQAQRKTEARIERQGNRAGIVPPADHPLLRVYETLALKAAIAHAKEVGATKVILSDAETAMMTEGHDRASVRQYTMDRQAPKEVVERIANELYHEKYQIDAGLKLNNEGGLEAKNGELAFPAILDEQGRVTNTSQAPQYQFRQELFDRVRDEIGAKETTVGKVEQEKGMRLHYDQTLPSAMEKLTGEKGKDVNLGVHKQAQVSSENYTETPSGTSVGDVVGSPVFHDASGQPKTQITGRMYDISSVPDKFTLTDPSRAGGGNQILRGEEPYIPVTQWETDTINKMGVNEGGVGMLRYLQQSQNPLIRALADDWAKFPESIQRITARIAKMDGYGYARNNQRREVDVALSHGLLYADNVERELIVAHEFGHGLTLAELDNPAKESIVRGLDDLRLKIVEMLPKEMQEVYDKAHGSDFLNRYVAGTTHFGELSNDFRTSEIVYGLLDTREFVSQGWSSPVFRNFMLELKAPKKVGWFNRFTNLVKELLGIGDKVQGSVFEEFLSRTDQLLQQGEYAAGFSNFAERFYKNLGFSDTLAQGQTQRALGLLMNGTYGLTKSDVFASLDAPSQIRSGEFITARRKFLNMQSEKSEDFMLHGKVMDELGFAIEQRGTDDLLHAALNGEAADIHSALEILPTATTDYLFARLRDFRDVLASIKAATTEKNEGLINLAQPRQVRQVIGEAYKTVDSLLKAELVHEQGRQIVRDMQAFAPDVYLDRILDERISRAPEVFGKNKVEQERFGFLKRGLGTIAQLARSDPTLAEYSDRGYELDRRRSDIYHQIVKVMGVDLTDRTNSLSKEALEQELKVMRQPLQGVLSKWMYLDQKAALDEGQNTTMLQQDHPEVVKLLSKLSPEQRKIVVNARLNTVVMNRVRQAIDLDMKRMEGSKGAAATIMCDVPTMKPPEAVKLAGSLFDAVNTDFSDPQKAQIANQQITTVQQQMTPDGFLSVLKWMQEEVGKWKSWQKFYDDNPAYVTARRMERWLAEINRGGKRKLIQGSSQKEVEQLAEGAKFIIEPYDQYAGKEDSYIPQEMSEEAFNQLKQHSETQIAILRQSGRFNPDDLAEIERTDPVLAFARGQAARVGAIPGFEAPTRTLSKGAEDLPWVWNHFTDIERFSNFWARRQFSLDARLELLNPDFVDRPDIRDVIREHRDNSLAPSSRTIQEVNKITTTWYMGFAPATALSNGFQTATTTIPELVKNNNGKILNSVARWKDAVALVAGNGIFRRGWGTTEMGDFVKQAIKDLEVSPSLYDENAAVQDALAVRHKQLMRKDKVQTFGQYMSSKLGAVTNASLLMFKQVEKFNRLVSLTSSFQLARDKGMSTEDATKEAYRFNRSVNYGGGPVNRPIGLFNKIPNVALLATNMQGYNIGVLSQLARYIQDGFFRPNLSPAEIHASRKALVPMLTTQFALAGTLGLPFVSAGLALLNQAFPDLEANKHIHEWIAGLFGEESENGNTLGNIAMTGLPSMLGWDMQSRLSLGTPIPGVSEFNGFQPEQLLGAPVGLLYNYLNGAGRLAQGDSRGAMSFVPPFVKKLTQLMIDDGKLRDYKNRPVFDPTFSETTGIALGFNPKRLSDFNAASRIAKQSEDVANRRMGQFHQKLAEDVLKGNFGSVRQTLLAQAQNDKSYNPADGVRAVARAAEELTFPRDLRREGSLKTSQGRTRLLDVLNVKPSSQVSETERLNFRTQVEQRLGLPSRVSMSDAQTANLMDQLRQQYPEATRVELRQRVNQLIRRQRLHTLSVGETD